MSLYQTIKRQSRSHTKLKPAKPAKDSRAFAGVVNHLSMFCTNLQKLLKPILPKQTDLD